MLTRIALFISTLVAAGVLAIGISLANADTRSAPPSDTASLTDGVITTPQVQVDTVYVPAPVTPQTITVHKTVTSAGSGEHENEGEGVEQ